MADILYGYLSLSLVQATEEALETQSWLSLVASSTYPSQRSQRQLENYCWF